MVPCQRIQMFLARQLAQLLFVTIPIQITVLLYCCTHCKWSEGNPREPALQLFLHRSVSSTGRKFGLIIVLLCLKGSAFTGGKISLVE